MAYKAVITQVSSVDTSGNMTATFDLKKNSTVLYPSLECSGQADDVLDMVTEKCNELSTQIREAKKIKVGDAIDIEE